MANEIGESPPTMRIRSGPVLDLALKDLAKELDEQLKLWAKKEDMGCASFDTRTMYLDPLAGGWVPRGVRLERGSDPAARVAIDRRFWAVLEEDPAALAIEEIDRYRTLLRQTLASLQFRRFVLESGYIGPGFPDPDDALHFVADNVLDEAVDHLERQFEERGAEVSAPRWLLAHLYRFLVWRPNFGGNLNAIWGGDNVRIYKPPSGDTRENIEGITSRFLIAERDLPRRDTTALAQRSPEDEAQARLFMVAERAVCGDSLYATARNPHRDERAEATLVLWLYFRWTPVALLVTDVKGVPGLIANPPASDLTEVCKRLFEAIHAHLTERDTAEELFLLDRAFRTQQVVGLRSGLPAELRPGLEGVHPGAILRDLAVLGCLNVWPLFKDDGVHPGWGPLPRLEFEPLDSAIGEAHANVAIFRTNKQRLLAVERPREGYRFRVGLVPPGGGVTDNHPTSDAYLLRSAASLLTEVSLLEHPPRSVEVSLLDLSPRRWAHLVRWRERNARLWAHDFVTKTAGVFLSAADQALVSNSLGRMAEVLGAREFAETVRGQEFFRQFSRHLWKEGRSGLSPQVREILRQLGELGREDDVARQFLNVLSQDPRSRSHLEALNEERGEEPVSPDIPLSFDCQALRPEGEDSAVAALAPRGSYPACSPCWHCLLETTATDLPLWLARYLRSYAAKRLKLDLDVRTGPGSPLMEGELAAASLMRTRTLSGRGSQAAWCGLNTYGLACLAREMADNVSKRLKALEADGFVDLQAGLQVSWLEGPAGVLVLELALWHHGLKHTEDPRSSKRTGVRGLCNRMNSWPFFYDCLWLRDDGSSRRLARLIPTRLFDRLRQGEGAWESLNQSIAREPHELEAKTSAEGRTLQLLYWKWEDRDD